MKYLEYCEKLFKDWKADKVNGKGLDIFEMNHVPEPYLYMHEGENPLFVLHNNPGSGMDMQLKKQIKDKNYEALAHRFGKYYLSDKFKNAGQAYRRIQDSIQFAKDKKYSGVVNVETIPFHSNTLDKKKAISSIEKNEILKNYINTLREYLTDKPVLALSACYPLHSINENNFKRSKWLRLQADVIGIDIKKSKMSALTNKGSKVTSALFQHDNKFFILMMGSNNFPKLA